MYDFSNETLPFTTKDTDGDKVVIVAKMPDGDYVGYWVSRHGGDCHTKAFEAADNILVAPTRPEDQIYDWLYERQNAHFLDAVRAFDSSGKKITGIKFIRAVVPADVLGEPVGLAAAKLAFERIAGLNWAECH